MIRWALVPVWLALAACGHDWSASDGSGDLGPADQAGDVVADDAAEDGVPPDDAATDDAAVDDGPAPDDATADDAVVDDGATDEGGTDDVAADDGPAPDDAPVPGCGDGILAADEECDDGDRERGDGCEPDCGFSCHDDAECTAPDGPCRRAVCVEADGGQRCEVEFLTGMACEDGDPCTLGDFCVGGGVCRGAIAAPRWYRDEDRDGYGGAGTVVCSTTPPAGDGWVGVGGDCCDTEPGANPSTTAFSSVGYACGSVLSFDWNCDGIASVLWYDCASCTVDAGGVCWTGPGWLPEGGGCVVPGCGEGGSLIDMCGPGCLLGPPTDTVQRCR
jgi:cysteine-rich repeat protein